MTILIQKSVSYWRLTLKGELKHKKQDRNITWLTTKSYDRQEMKNRCSCREKEVKVGPELRHWETKPPNESNMGAPSKRQPYGRWKHVRVHKCCKCNIRWANKLPFIIGKWICGKRVSKDILVSWLIAESMCNIFKLHKQKTFCNAKKMK